MGGDARTHYDRLAATYDENWAYSEDFLSWMTEAIDQRLRIGAGDRVVDIGCGTGLYARRLVDRAESVTCVDPSQGMLAQIPDDPRLVRVLASAEEVAASQVDLPGSRYDAVLVKEAIHHVVDRAGVIRGLSTLLAPGGRLLVVMLPTRIDYPLFQAARERFQSLQPDPEGVAAAMREAGLNVELTYDGFPLMLSTQRYVEMVNNRYMSLLSTFSDDELAAGVEEIRRGHPGEWVKFVDRFAFVLGTVH
ncbi:class I SAM-dependent methyltransferase [Amycolatopsis pigmentata]|uniref:Class I SAM-dependent methyltransferase n=1 Tax=Amycolatopsis pigmentata TaxID=450801 RepID=A0ABW5FKC1_9PSEU